MMMAPDPFGRGFSTVVAKAMRPDVAVFHGLQADHAGNVRFGYANDNTILAEASRTVIVTVEEVVPELPPEARDATFMPGILVDAVAEAMYGAHPAGCPGAYPVDDAHMALYARDARTDADFAAYLRRTVFGLAGHEAYVREFVPEGWGRSGQLPLREAGD